MFPLSAFTSDTVSQLTGLSIDQLHRWDRIGFFPPSYADPNRRRPNSRVYSFRDLVGLRTIAQLRERGVPFSDLWKVHDYFGPNPEDWSKRKFYTVGHRVFFSHDDAILAARPLGQGVTPQMLDLGKVGRDMQNAVRNLPHRSGKEIGRITRSRQILGGTPVIAGTRIPSKTIVWFARQGYGVEEIIREFPRLTECDIAAAIEFEDSQVESSRKVG